MTHAAENGTFAAGPLPPGRYDLKLRAAAHGTLRLRGLIVLPDQDLDLGELRLPEPGEIVAALSGLEAADLLGARFEIRDKCDQITDPIDSQPVY